jgi:hypothetical protein
MSFRARGEHMLQLNLAVPDEAGVKAGASPEPPDVEFLGNARGLSKQCHYNE